MCSDFTVHFACFRCEFTVYCAWVYTGAGWLYDMVANPMFILVYTVSVVPMNFAARFIKRYENANG